MAGAQTPRPLLDPNTPVDWWFTFKLNSAEEPGAPMPDGMVGIFDHPNWKRPSYEADNKKYSQHYVFASSAEPDLQEGKAILGTSLQDPLGATFGQVYDGDFYYVVWNDQFYGDPRDNGDSPWGHSKGMIAWNDDGDGLVLQVSTPSWPGAASRKHPRMRDGNTLGFVSDDDIEVSQHFFCLALNQADVVAVLDAMKNASVVTAPDNPQVVRLGGPKTVLDAASGLGRLESHVTTCTQVTLSSGVRLLSKPSGLAVPPWQLVSAQLGGVDLRVASWWETPKIYSTGRNCPDLHCWDTKLGEAGAVDIATTGTWGSKVLGLEGGLGRDKNHAKIGVSTSRGSTLSIFGDMNQQGALCPGYLHPNQPCSSSQNGRGGMFYVVDHPGLWQAMTSLLKGSSAPTSAP